MVPSYKGLYARQKWCIALLLPTAKPRRADLILGVWSPTSIMVGDPWWSPNLAWICLVDGKLWLELVDFDSANQSLDFQMGMAIGALKVPSRTWQLPAVTGSLLPIMLLRKPFCMCFSFPFF